MHVPNVFKSTFTTLTYAIRTNVQRSVCMYFINNIHPPTLLGDAYIPDQSLPSCCLLISLTHVVYLHLKKTTILTTSKCKRCLIHYIISMKAVETTQRHLSRTNIYSLLRCIFYYQYLHWTAMCSQLYDIQTECS